MTTYVAEGTAEGDVPVDRRREPVLDDEAVAELTRLGSQIEAQFGVPQDIEWARADGRFFVVQSRPITALPLPEADPPTDWSVADPRAMYVRASIVEQLPDPLTPLFADLIDGSVTRSLQALFTELTGEKVVRDVDVNLPTLKATPTTATAAPACSGLCSTAPRPSSSCSPGRSTVPRPAGGPTPTPATSRAVRRGGVGDQAEDGPIGLEPETMPPGCDLVRKNGGLRHGFLDLEAERSAAGPAGG
jgi:hypothetical protein